MTRESWVHLWCIWWYSTSNEHSWWWVQTIILLEFISINFIKVSSKVWMLVLQSLKWWSPTMQPINKQRRLQVITCGKSSIHTSTFRKIYQKISRPGYRSFGSYARSHDQHIIPRYKLYRLTVKRHLCMALYQFWNTRPVIRLMLHQIIKCPGQLMCLHISQIFTISVVLTW